jgi:sigma-54-interacting transcriptional regulator
VNLRTIADAHQEMALVSTLRLPNLLLIGPDAAIREFLDPLIESLEPPVVYCDGATPEFPNPPVGSLIVHDIARLTPDHQQQLLDWISDPIRSARVIATSAGPVFPDVKGGTFSDGLYYRINTLTVMLTGEADIRTVGQPQRSAEPPHWIGTSL